jgi:putative copper resistance protein D
LAFVTAVLWLGLVAGQMSGNWAAAREPAAIWMVVADTRFGHIWLVRIVGLTLLLLASLFALRVPYPVFAILAALLLSSLGLIGHAAAGGLIFIRALNDATHLLTAGFWLGALPALLLLIRLYHREPDMLFAPFRLFSQWGVYAVTLLAITGLINATLILPIYSISSKSAYVDVLATKITLAFVMIALAAVNRSQFLPVLRNRKSGVAGRLNHNVAIEIVLGLVVIAFASYLGLMPPI